jgi:hypothetical membrane protein
MRTSFAMRWCFGLAIVQMVVVMFMLPAWSFDGYSLMRNTTSHLGAQGSPHAWVMNVTFVVLGVCTISAVTPKYRRHPFHLVAITVFGSALALCGVFQHEPLLDGVHRDAREAWLHSVFASLTGFAFTVFAVAVAMVSLRTGDRLLSIAVAVMATVLSLAMGFDPDRTGLWQRLIFLLAFPWLFYVSSAGHRLENDAGPTPSVPLEMP